MSTRRGVYEAKVAEAKPSHARIMKPWERMSEEERALFGEPDKGPEPEKKAEKVKAKGKAKAAPKKKATRKKATSKKK